MKFRLVLGLGAVLALSAWAVTATADPFTLGVCSSAGTALSGDHHGNLTVTGNAYVANGASLNVSDNLTIAKGACLDAFSTGTVTVGGNIKVEKGAVLGLGCSPGAIGPYPPCGTTTTADTVGGNITANQPLTMYLTAVHVSGNVISNGGGDVTAVDTENGPGLSFPVKENTIDGNLIIQGWAGAWVGALRNHVDGNLIFSKNVGARVGDEQPFVGVLDSSEIADNTVGGNLICHGNTPSAQIGDSHGGPNAVSGKAIGECSTLVG
jgi:hypothetical protein